ncbi:proteasome endopeptidase complex, beta subunit [Haladaptatus paucihalophilus DX253]|uniref:Proteasome subunit beta n=1 Tax=Haladaptatus paucihalophilus DX253 TaxID=797209 RepID=E7QQS0_HALPU|nr:proteasome subunit beta [Haladaptatus paucihalophilus]EFW93334.1 proteasome endopeptidase complex, beta subunit [Haladaptatus paucihalophilus DX253]SHK51697.1 proteasome endopeptidase complex, beta component Threonine peptidase. MEROPS family T01A [Haladaptatus paucihalophilus DX253]
MSDTIVKTGTTTVALTTDDEVLLAADRRASLGGRFVTNKAVQKVQGVHPTAALTMAGGVGDLQSYIRTLRAEASLYETRRGEPIDMAALSTLAGTLLREGPYRGAQPTLGGVDRTGPHVYDLDTAGGVMEADYHASGSGMQLAYGVLEREFEPNLPTDVARRVAANAIESAIERDTASGNGLTVATVSADGVEIRGYDAFSEVAA